jgi:hypothetical protein
MIVCLQDEAGFAAFTEPAAVPVYALARQQALCDNQFRPYPEGFQEAYRAGQVLQYVRSGELQRSRRGFCLSMIQVVCGL